MTTKKLPTKITRDRALVATAYCRKHNIKYVGQGSYPNTVKSALKANTTAPNGVRIHFPRDWVDTNKQALVENPRAYVLWFGEPIEQVAEAFAYILMVTRDKERSEERRVGKEGGTQVK